MIVQIRVEDKIVTNTGLMMAKEQRANILAIDDLAATTDKLMAAQIKMAVDTNSAGKCMVKTTEEAIKVINDPRAKDMNLFVATRRVSDIYKIFKACPNAVKEVNLVRHSYRETKIPAGEAIRLSGGVVSKEELEQLKEISAAGIPVFRQNVNNDKKEMLEEMIEEVN